MARHRRKLSGPLLDRMDLLVPMPRPRSEQLHGAPTTTSAQVLASVLEARERQAFRLAGTGLLTNAALTPRLMREHVRAQPDALACLRGAYERGTLSARGHQRLLRVARTIADLEASDRVHLKHVKEALGMRQEDVVDGAQAA